MNSPQPATTAQDAEESARGGALVTGVSLAPGFQIAQALAARGHEVHVTDLDGRLATQAATEIGPRAFGSALDVRSVAACRAAAARTRRRVGSLKVWVNNAAVLKAGLAWELDERTRQRMVEVNLLGSINGTLAALEEMRSEGAGHVVNVVSLSGLLPGPAQAVYAGSLQAVVAFSRAAAADLEEAGLGSIHVSCLSAARDRLPAGESPEFSPSAGPGRIVEGLYQLLDQPRPLLTIPHWRGAVLRAAYSWPALGGLGRMALPRGRRRRRSGRRRRRAGA